MASHLQWIDPPQVVIMAVYTICTLIAIWWLCYRLYKFLTIPVIKIVSTLKIRTPPATKVSIDKISKDSITIHWENEPIKSNKSSESISHFLLYLNNLQVAIFPNSPNSLYTCCSITGLEQETQYQLDFITVNRMGFINKLPSLYCMTNSREEKQNNSALKKSGKWRRNTLTATAAFQDTSMVQSNSVNFSSPAYASLTALQDLESYSIDDLKKILVCAQEDLHDVLSQQASLFQDFKESKLQLELELDNLKSYWSHEIDLRKSLKSNIKSLENSKLLSDLKLEKLNKNIDQSKSKISKMEKDMQTWSQQDLEQFNTNNLEGKYTETLEKMNEEIVLLSQRIKSVQQEVSLQEEKNKKLSTLKKSSNTPTTYDSANHMSKVNTASMSSLSLQISNSSPADSPDTTMSLSVLLKSIFDHTYEKTGLLSSQGEDILTKLDSNNQAVKIIRDQIYLDQEMEFKWKTKRNRMLKRIETLEATFTDYSINNRHLRANLMAQPYSSQTTGNSETNSQNIALAPLHDSPSPRLDSPPASTRSLIENINNPAITLAGNFSNQLNQGNVSLGGGAPNLILHNPSTYSSNKPSPASVNHIPTVNESHMVPQVTNEDSFTHSTPTTATILANATASNQMFGWNHGQEQQQQQQQQQQDTHPQSELEQPFGYDDASHLISGLQDMIYDETDYPESISNYSKGFTTDQLDNYWATQRNLLNNNQISPPKFASPVTPYINEGSSTFQFGSAPPRLGQSQSLLAATLADSSFKSFGEGLPELNAQPFHVHSGNVEGEFMSDGKDNHGAKFAANSTDNISTNGSLSQKITPNMKSNSTPVNKENTFNLQSQTPNLNNGNNLSLNSPKLASPKHSFIWHASHATPSSSQTAHNENAQHTRHLSNASSGSNASTWSKLNWKNWSPQNQHPPEDAIDETSSIEPPVSAQNKKGSSSPTSSGGRRMSRLLSRSGVNSIFKLPSHEEKKGDSSPAVNE